MSLDQTDRDSILRLVADATDIPERELRLVGRAPQGRNDPVRIPDSDSFGGMWISREAVHFIVLKGDSPGSDPAVIYEYENGAYGGLWNLSTLEDSSGDTPGLYMLAAVVVTTRPLPECAVR
jgi:hypothetical protein